MSIAPSSPTLRARDLLLRRQLARQDRDEDDVVDAKDDLEKRERRKRDQGPWFERSSPSQLFLGNHVAVSKQEEGGGARAIRRSSPGPTPGQAPTAAP